MRLENILALTQGSLSNEPFVSAFDGIAIDSKKVKRGNLFIGNDPHAIEEAILNGAYGIVFDKPTQIADFEIAWIKVDSVDNALLRLLRFHLIDKELDVYQCDPVTLKLAQQIMTPFNFLAVNGGVKELFKELWYCEKETIILFSQDLTSADLFALYKAFPEIEGNKIEIIEQTLFETSFIYENIFYERQELSPFFVPFLEHLLNFLKSKKIDYRLRPFKPIDHFQPVFTNLAFQEREFGTSDKVLIFEPSLALVESQIHFLERETGWARTVYLLPDFVKDDILASNSAVHFYNDDEEIVDMLKTIDFHFALIAAADKSILHLKPRTEPMQLTLEF